MAKPSAIDTSYLTPQEVEHYKRLQAELGDEYAYEYIKEKASVKPSITRLEERAAATPVPTPVAVKPVEQTYSFNPEDVADEEGLAQYSGYETESERLARQAADIRKEIVAGGKAEMPPEAAGLPPVEPEEVMPTYTAVVPERAKKAPESVVAVEKTEGEKATAIKATRLQQIKASLKEDEKAAFKKVRQELINQGASFEEAEARSAQIIAGTMTGPREILSNEQIMAESPELTPDYLVNPEAYKSGEAGFFEAMKPKPLMSARQVAVAESSKKRGADNRALIEEEVNKNFAKVSVNTKIEDPEAWKENEYQRLLFRGLEDVRVNAKRVLTQAAQAKGETPDEKAIKEYAQQVADLWLADVDPELAKSRSGEGNGFMGSGPALEWATSTGKALKWNSKDFSFDIVDSGNVPFERVGVAGLRTLGGALRAGLNPIVEALSYDVDDSGKPLDKTDVNYKVYAAQRDAFKALNDAELKGESGDIGDYLMAYNPFGYISSIEQSNKDARAPELRSGSYLNDLAFSVAVGRFIGDDISSSPTIKSYYDKNGMSYIPFIAGLTAEILLPVSPLTLAGKSVGTAGETLSAAGRVAGKASRLGRIGKALETAGETVSALEKPISTPIRSTLSTVGNRIAYIKTADALLEAAGEAKLTGPEKTKIFFNPTKATDYAAEWFADGLARKVTNGEAIPQIAFPEYNAILYKAEAANELYDTLVAGTKGLPEWGITPALNSELLQTVRQAVKGGILSDISKSYELTADEITQLDRAIDDGIDAIIARDKTALDKVRSSGIFSNTLNAIGKADSEARLGAVASVIRQDLPALFAESTFNNWTMLTPTTLITNKAFEKYGEQINKATKEVLFGAKTDEEIAQLISGEKVLIDNPSKITDILEGYVARTGKTPKRVSQLIKAVKTGEVTVNDFNEINDFVKSEVAYRTIPSKVAKGFAGLPEAIADIRTTGLATERAAVPVVRRATVVRAIEDITRPVFGRTLSKGLQKYKVLRSVPFVGKQIPRMNIEVYNKVKMLQARINELPEQVTLAYRTAIMGGKNAGELFLEELDAALNTVVNKKTGEVREYLTKAETANELGDLMRTYFSIEEKGELFKAFYNTQIENVIDALDKGGAFEKIDIADGKTATAYKVTPELVVETIKSLRKYNAAIAGKGLSTKIFNFPTKEGVLDMEAINSMLIAKILDKKRLQLIDAFGEDLARTNPSLIAGAKIEENAATVVKELEGGVAPELSIDWAKATYDEVLAKAISEGMPEGSKIGEPAVETDAAGRKFVTRKWITPDEETGLDWFTVADELHSPITKDIVLKFVNSQENLSRTVADIYQLTLREAASVGEVDVYTLNSIITEKLLNEINIAERTREIVSSLRESYPRFDFGDAGQLIEGEGKIKFEAFTPEKQGEILADIKLDPAKYTNSKIELDYIKELKAQLTAKQAQNLVEFQKKLDAWIAKELNPSNLVTKDWESLEEAWIYREYRDLTRGAGVTAESGHTLRRRLTEYAMENPSLIGSKPLDYGTIGLSKRLETAYERIAKTNVTENVNVTTVERVGSLDAQIEGAIRSLVAETTERLVNVSANDMIDKIAATGIPINRSGKLPYGDVFLKAKQLGPISMLVDPTTYHILDQMTGNNVYLQKGMEDLALRNKNAADWTWMQMLKIVDDVRMRTVQGLLGGYIAPNTRFFGVNDFSATLIAAVTNPTYVGTVTKTLFNPKTSPFTRGLTEGSRAVGAPRTIAGTTLSGATIGAFTAGPVGAAIGAAGGAGMGAILSRVSSKVAYGASDFAPIITPSGKIITSRELEDILARNIWRQSQVSFEFSDRLLAETVDALTSTGTKGDFAKSTAQHLTTLSRNRNFWNAVASESDISFRRSVFKEALIRGLTETEAANLAKNTLLDYSQVSELERKTVARGILFYSFMRQSMVEVLEALAREPFDNALMKKVIVQKYAADKAAQEQGVYLQDYQRSRLWVNMLTKGTQYDGNQVLFFGIDDPMLSNLNSVISVFGLMNAYEYTNPENLPSFTKVAVEWAAGKRPELDFIKDMYETEGSGKDGFVGNVPATDLAALSQMGAFGEAITRFDLKPITNEELDKMKKKYGGLPPWLQGKPTYNGQYWKFGSEEGKEAFITYKYVANIAGFQRTLYDWAQITAKAQGVKNPELKRYKDGKWYLYAAGLETPMEAPDWIQVQSQMVEAQRKDLEALKKGEIKPTRYKEK